MIDLDATGDVWTLTLNRPQKANSLTKSMLVELAENVERSTAARVLIIRGKGRVFSAGADLDEAKAGLATDGVWERLSKAIANHSGLTIAALNGTVAGGALGMVLACDLRIAVQGARVFYPVMKLGFLPQPSDPKRLAALIGPARAKLVLMAGAKLSSDEAYEFGLFDRVCAVEDLDGQLAELSADALAAPSHVFSGIKKLCS